MKSKFIVKTIRELEDEGMIEKIQDGNHGEKHPKSNDFIPHGIPFITAKDLKDNILHLDTCYNLSKKQSDSLRIGFAKTGDVLLTHKGTMGRVSIVPEIEDYLMLSPQVTFYRINLKKLSNKFLFYAFQDPFFQSQLNLFSEQTTRKYLGITEQRILKIRYVDFDEQKKICVMLGKLDDKIINIKNQNSVLENIIKTIYTSWFIDFDGVSEFDDSELGKIPKKWKVDILDSTGKIITGKTPPTKEQDNFGDKFPFITIPDMQGFMWAVKTERSLSEKGKNKIKGSFLPSYSVCVSCIATPGLVTLTLQDSFTNQQINSIIPNQEMSPFFLFQTLKMKKEHIIQFASGGTATLNLNKTDFSLIKIILPTPNLVNDFHKMTSPIFEKIKKNYFKIENMTKIRDVLLPKLMSGKIRV